MIANTNLYGVIEALVICGGIVMMIGCVGATVWVCIREDRGRQVMPWGARSRVEKEKAHTEVLQESLKQDALEVKRIALAHQRTKVLEAVENDDTESVMLLGLPSGSGVSDGQYSVNGGRGY